MGHGHSIFSPKQTHLRQRSILLTVQIWECPCLCGGILVQYIVDLLKEKKKKKTRLHETSSSGGFPSHNKKRFNIWKLSWIRVFFKRKQVLRDIPIFWMLRLLIGLRNMISYFSWFCGLLCRSPGWRWLGWGQMDPSLYVVSPPKRPAWVFSRSGPSSKRTRVDTARPLEA